MNEQREQMRFHPGEYIEDEMVCRNWDVEDLARKSGLNESRLQAIIDGKARVMPVDAKGLSDAFGTSCRLWMNLQNSFTFNQSQGEG